MKISLKINSDNTVNETIELNDFIKEKNLKGVISKVIEKPAKDGTMSSGIPEILSLIVSNSIIPVAVSSLFTIIINYFKTRSSEVELSFECPDGKKFSQKFKVSSDKERKTIIADFEKKFNETCKKKIVLV